MGLGALVIQKSIIHVWYDVGTCKITVENHVWVEVMFSSFSQITLHWELVLGFQTCFETHTKSWCA